MNIDDPDQFNYEEDIDTDTAIRLPGLFYLLSVENGNVKKYNLNHFLEWTTAYTDILHYELVGWVYIFLRQDSDAYEILLTRIVFDDSDMTCHIELLNQHRLNYICNKFPVVNGQYFYVFSAKFDTYCRYDFRNNYWDDIKFIDNTPKDLPRERPFILDNSCRIFLFPREFEVNVNN